MDWKRFEELVPLKSNFSFALQDTSQKQKQDETVDSSVKRSEYLLDNECKYTKNWIIYVLIFGSRNPRVQAKLLLEYDATFINFY